jgi:hypothetical protein
MSGSASATTSYIGASTSAFWERLWRTSGIQFIALCIIAYFISGYQPQVSASSDTLIVFYHGHHTRILIAAVVSGLAVLYLMWFAAAIRVTLADAGEDGWGAAATASSAAVGALFLLLAAINAGLAYSIDGPGNQTLLPGMNGLAWAGFVMTSFVRAMLFMSAAFGLWRAGLISNGLFAVGVAAVVLAVLGGTTWASDGIWAPDGVYSRFISPIVGLLWAMIVSWVLLNRSPSARAGW